MTAPLGKNPYADLMMMKKVNAREAQYYLERQYGPPGWGMPEPGVAYTLPTPGEQVVLQNVRSRPELNGSCAEICSSADAEGFVRVRLTDRTHVKVQMRNLLPFGKPPRKKAGGGLGSDCGSASTVSDWRSVAASLRSATSVGSAGMRPPRSEVSRTSSQQRLGSAIDAAARSALRSSRSLGALQANGS
eukprot:TRINITY_DN4763_c0_g1_i2.p2 TRINITY_DN4763_c0_g1~~TRINITY_DN4763_c0_g1_i2.p2  ORF type:complete len:189 (+),score=37.03 TRINITY_DN4763_c0_g1_i2:98-664(+)